MKDYLNYARGIFELPYTEQAVHFQCVKDLVRAGHCRCICIPGIAMNYIAAAIKTCFKDTKGRNSVWWNNRYRIYIPDTAYESRVLIFNLKADGENRGCWFADDVCSEADVGDFCYIVIREQALDRETAQKKTELLLWGKREAFDNSVDCFKLFCRIASTYHNEFDMDVFSDMLFRLFLFLFPEAALAVIKDNLEGSGSQRSFADYHIKLSEDFSRLCEKSGKYQKTGPGFERELMESIREFTGFDLYNVYNVYRDEGTERTLKELSGKQLNGFQKYRIELKNIQHQLEGSAG